MQAIILAAGMGKRLRALTKNNTKCMVEVNGKTMIQRLLEQIDCKNLSGIVIVVGYEGQKLIDYIDTLQIKTPLVYIDNPIYNKTNNIYSLSLAKNYLLQEDTLLFESDLIMEDAVIDELIEDPRDTLALVDKYENWMDGTVVKLDENDNILDFIPGKKFNFEEIDQYYKTVNIYKFSKQFSETHYVPFLEAYSKALGNNEYYEQVLKVITMIDNPIIKAKRLTGQKWYEIDDIQDLDIASSIFAENDDEAVDKIFSRYGGYWRYPKMMDFCYLVNPYFPTERMLNEIKANADRLITQYPSGMKVNSLLAARNFSIDSDHIVVGNGAAELIKSLMESSSGKVGFIRPTFEEYPNRYDEKSSVCFFPESDDFSYDENDIIEFFTNTAVDILVLINPDNPTGNFISKEGVIKIAEWCKQTDTFLIYDESFIDFSDEGLTMIDEDILGRFDNLVVVKSISKSYGVPGLRLGIAASSNEKYISYLKKDVSIWNINSLAEFYLQISDKYRRDYSGAIEKFKEIRKDFYSRLSSINEIKVFPTQANYFLVELTGGIKAKELTKILLIKYDILIKDLSTKIKVEDRQFIRIAIKTPEENEALLKAFSAILTDKN